MTPKRERPDRIQKQFWHYWELWAVVIAILIAGRFLLPRLPLLRGWEQKFSAAAVELARSEIPDTAARSTTVEEAVSHLRPELQVPTQLIQIEGPLLVATWKCKPMKDEGGCLRYLWKGEPLTLVISSKAPKDRKGGPFAKAGWAGHYIITQGLALALVGPFDPVDLLGLWPAAREINRSSPLPVLK